VRSMNGWLAAAPRADPPCGQVAAMVSMADLAARPPRAGTDGETISLGTPRVRWFDTRHLPHAWECGFFSRSPRTLIALIDCRRPAHLTS
jgi:hypothetical protein